MPDDLLLVLHGLRLSSLATVQQVAARWQLEESVVATTLGTAAEAGWSKERTGRLAGWSLTREGRTHGESLLADELDVRRARAEVDDLYRHFRTLNPPFLAVCTDWQLRGTVDDPQPNDHSDHRYDAEVIDRLEDLHRSLWPAVDGVGEMLPRFGSYPARMANALDRVRENQLDWFTKPVIDSYHTIWFELHEDLLATLNLDRATETADDAGFDPTADSRI